MRTVRIVACVGVVLALFGLTMCSVSAQEKPAAASEKAAPVATETPAVSSTLDELEQAWATIYTLQRAYAQMLQQADTCAATLAQYRGPAAVRDLQQLELDLKTKIEARHPGYTFNTQTGALTKIPEPPPAPAAAAAPRKQGGA